MSLPEEDEEMSDREDEENQPPAEEAVYLPGQDLADDEELTYDKSAYNMLHAAQTGSPCLSFDIIPDGLGNNRTTFPMTCYMVCGTQSSQALNNSVLVMKMGNLTKMNADGDDSDEEYLDEDEEDPQLRTYSMKHMGGVNRIRHCKIDTKNIAATWSETGKVHIWDLTSGLDSLEISTMPNHQPVVEKKPMFSFSGHQTEGFAMDWSPTVAGRLVTGSCNKNIHLWSLCESGTWLVDQRPLTSHTASVEDIQWSPNESNVLASCSADQTIRIWDARAVGEKACMITCKAHSADVNVISWNKTEPFILSGGDDGELRVWDLRNMQQETPVAIFKHHLKPITSVEWHPTDSTVFAASGEDDQITLWDLAVEKDDIEMETGSAQNKDLPPQLLFMHMGQKDIKEIHWHPQLPGVVISTAHSDFNIFKTISV